MGLGRRLPRATEQLGSQLCHRLSYDIVAAAPLADVNVPTRVIRYSTCRLRHRDVPLVHIGVF